MWAKLNSARDAVEEIIASADVLLLPSETESFGMAALEAMASAVPPVVSDTGGLREVIEDGITGCIQPVGDVEGMTQRVLELLSDEEKRHKMGTEARRRAFETFNIDKAMDAYEELYRSV